MMQKTINLSNKKGLVHILCFLPLVVLALLMHFNAYGADPSKAVEQYTGIVALRILLVIVMVPLMATIFEYPLLYAFRRILGVWCFLWASGHALSYFVYEIGITHGRTFFSEVTQNMYLQLGIVAWIVLFLMIISSYRWIRPSLGVWWKRLHNLVYPVFILINIHYILSMKIITVEPVLYIVLGLIAMAYKYRKA